ncbi:MAG: glycosyltransferase family 2 protein [Bacteroidales bacterium]|nr:glycosyltransferase family 2 protein [Bacteroidales bacterium]
MEKLLTVIVPVFKVEKYINQCLDSLVIHEDEMAQMEVLVVNDGTPDSSADIALTYEARFPGIFKVVDKENGGHGSAWNVGVSLSSGRYLLFLDSDDYVENLPRLVSCLKETTADLVMTDKVEFHEGTSREETIRIEGIPPMHLFTLEDRSWSPKGHGVYYSHFHTCVYRKEVIGGFAPLFKEKSFYDDAILSVAPLISATTFIYLGFPVYHYRLGRPGQTMDRAVMMRNIDMQAMQRRYEIDFAEAHPVAPGPRKDLLDGILSSACKSQCDMLFKVEGPERMKLLSSWVSYVKSHFPEWKRVPEISLFGHLPYPVYRLVLKSRNALRKVISF